MAATTVDEEAFAKAVQCYPVLYGKSMKQFKDQNMKGNTWKVADSVAGITSGRRSTMSSPKRLMLIVIARPIAKYPG